jgi:hypothetical protein
MIFNYLTTIIVILMTWGGHALSQGQTNQQLIEITKKAFKARENHPKLSRKEKFARAFEDSFKGISAERRTIALANYLYDIDATNAEWAMSTMITMGVIDLLAADPEFIKDWSYLRQMIANEKDPRKFYLLSEMASMSKPPNDDFVAARAHMLFTNGRVAREQGEYTKPYAHDVSLYAYTAIMANLQSLEAKFVPLPDNLPHEEQAMILAKWLKANWPGCGNLEIPDNPVNEKVRSENATMDSRERLREHPATEQPKEVGESGILRYILVGVAAMLVLAGAWFGMRRMKSGA